MSRNSALKVIDHALSGKEGIENCEKFVGIAELKQPPRRMNDEMLKLEMKL